MKLIREESGRLKERIREYQRRITVQTEMHNSALMAKKERLEASRLQVQRWLRDCHVTEQVTQQQDISQQLIKSTDVELDCRLESKLSLNPKGVLI